MMRYQQGDTVAFDELYGRYAPRAYGYIRKHIVNEQLASDIFQAVFLRIHSSRFKFHSGQPFAPWFFTVTKNVIYDHLRKLRAENAVNAGVDFEKVLAVVAPEEQGESAIQNLDLSALGAEQKQALRMRFNEGSTFEQIAKSLKTTQSNARQLVSRAIKKLRRNNESK